SQLRGQPRTGEPALTRNNLGKNRRVTGFPFHPMTGNLPRPWGYPRRQGASRKRFLRKRRRQKMAAERPAATLVPARHEGSRSALLVLALAVLGANCALVIRARVIRALFILALVIGFGSGLHIAVRMRHV